jgi:hypothetical protein
MAKAGLGLQFRHHAWHWLSARRVRQLLADFGPQADRLHWVEGRLSRPTPLDPMLPVSRLVFICSFPSNTQLFARLKI